MYDPRARIEQGAPFPTRAEFGGHIDAAEEHRIEARACLSNLIGRFQTMVRLDDRMQTDIDVVLVEQLVEGAQLVR